jgi:hypothetical protein
MGTKINHRLKDVLLFSAALLFLFFSGSIRYGQPAKVCEAFPCRLLMFTSKSKMTAPPPDDEESYSFTYWPAWIQNDSLCQFQLPGMKKCGPGEIRSNDQDLTRSAVTEKSKRGAGEGIIAGNL